MKDGGVRVYAILALMLPLMLQRAPATAQSATTQPQTAQPKTGTAATSAPVASPRPTSTTTPPVASPSGSARPTSGATSSPGTPRFGAAPENGARIAPFQEMRTRTRPLVFAALPLAEAENAALAVSPDVVGARARLLQSRYALAAARSGIAPSFIANYAQVPQGNPPGPNVISRQVTTGLQVTIGDFLAYSPAVREAAFALAASEADVGAAEAAERVKVVALYFDALKARAVAISRRDALTLAESQLRAAHVRAVNGDAPELDVVRAEVAVAKATADVETSTAADLNALSALASETTASEIAFTATAPTEFAAVDSKLIDPQTVVALARATRPELRSAKLAADAARTAIRSARAAGFPLLTVSGGYLVGTDSGVPINAPAVNAQLTVPLGSANRHRVDVAEARALEAQSKAAATDRQITLEVAASARTLGAADRAAAATTRARQAAETELRATQTGYRIGASSSFEVSFARSTYAQAVVDELSALYDLEKARATLEIGVGR